MDVNLLKFTIEGPQKFIDREVKCQIFMEVSLQKIIDVRDVILSGN